MIYKLKDVKDRHFQVVGSLENILDFLDYPSDWDFDQVSRKLKNDKQYQNDTVSYSLEESGVHVAVRETGEYVANVRDILQGLAVIDMFETEDEGNDEYEPGWYDIVDDDHKSLIF